MAAPYKTSSICFHQPIREKYSPGPASCSTTGQSDQRREGNYGKGVRSSSNGSIPNLGSAFRLTHTWARDGAAALKVGVQGKAGKTGVWVTQRQGRTGVTTDLVKSCIYRVRSGPEASAPFRELRAETPAPLGACAASPDAFCFHRVRGQGEGLRESGRLGSRIALGQELDDPLQVKGHKRALERW